MSNLKQALLRQYYIETEPYRTQYLNQLESNQWLSLDELLALQQQNLQNLLNYAYEYVPYYHKLFDKTGFHPRDFADNPDTFQQIPFLTKDIIRQNYDDLMSTDPPRRNTLLSNKTSGSSGEPLFFLQDAICRDSKNAHVYHHMQRTNWTIGGPQGWIWGNILAGIGAELPSPKQRFKDWLLGRASVNAYLLTPQNMELFANQLSKMPGTVLYSYASCAHQFAKFVQENNLAHKIYLVGVLTSAEVLYPAQRKLIEKVFSCEVFNIYGSEEAGPIAGECQEHTGLHINLEGTYVEIFNNGQPVSNGQEGEVVLTNLNSHGFPFIRYQIQDWAQKKDTSCSCGRGLPLLDVIHGRQVDLFKARDGKMTWGGFAGRMLAIDGVQRYQYIQKSYDLIVARIVQSKPISPEKLQNIQEAAKIALGDNVEVQFEFVDDIPRQKSGKHRYFISELED